MRSVYGKDFASVYNEKWAFWGPKMWPFLRRAVMRHNPNASTWLDLCCGTGSLLKLVCQNGFVATGVDLSPYQISYARRNAPDAKLMLQDIRSLSVRGKFDVVTCMFDSLNYLTSRRDLAMVFRKVRKVLNARGLFVFDMNTFDGLQDNWCRTSAIHEPWMTLMVESSFDRARARGRCLITGFVKKGRLYRNFQEEHIERGYKAWEIEQALQNAALSFKKCDGHSLGRPKKRSGRLLYVCRPEQAPTGVA